MKCPKCGYLAFETGDRCKNCGYDFSLIAAGAAAAPDPDLAFRIDGDEAAAPELWLHRLDRSMDEASRPIPKPEHLTAVPEPPAPPAPPAARIPAPSLPLFNPSDPDDVPLVALPMTPRAPLAVRRAPDTARLRAVPKVARMPEPALNFPEPAADAEAVQPTPARRARPQVADERHEVGARRAAAAAIDHALLLAIDLAVLYFTLRMAGLGTGDVRLLPPAPLLMFLVLLKLAYFTAFTAVGGQTIGKMAMGIRVIADHGAIDSARAIRRALAGLLSLAPLGLGFLPAFFGSDRRTLHDRLTGTRVVGLPSV